ncbi:hypothetical protein PG990_014522 [Apiospora arundinis]|uniref:Kinase-like domain-containing protein n=1 Tax=Apiospora arundinis TaxID=335852 RepID=A0ABR2HK31_9PEZI
MQQRTATAAFGSRLLRSSLPTPLTRLVRRQCVAPSARAECIRPRSFATAIENTASGLSPSTQNPFAHVGASVHGSSGRKYIIKQVLQDRQDRHVYLAEADHQKFVLKTLFEPEYSYALSLQHKFSDNPYLRAVRDTIPGENMFVNEYLSDHLLNFAWKDISLVTQKRILRDALRGLASMHAHDIAHLDVKANNIMVDYHTTEDEVIVVDRVQLSDLEDSTYIPPQQALRGIQVGNHWWRSPEAHVKGAINKQTDIFSFAIVSIFLLLRRVIFWMDMPRDANDPRFAILERQISHFAEWDDLDDFLEYLGRSHPWRSSFNKMARSFGSENPRRPFAMWKSDLLDADFKDLIRKMTHFDPRKRITAQQALDHAWFRDIQT